MARRERREATTTHAARTSARRGDVAAWLRCRLLVRLAGLAGSALLLCSAGCSRSGRSANAPDAERQSDAEYDVARDLYARRDPRGALAHAQKSVELNDANPDALHFVALLYLSFCASEVPDECHLAEAETATRRAIKLRPDFREAQNTLGVILINQKKYDEAVSVLDPLAHDILYQTPWDAWGNLGRAYFEKGKLDDAVTALKRSVTAEPRYCVGNYHLGLALEKKGELDAAQKALSEALETKRPECQSLQDAFEARARVHSKSKNCELAKGDWERCRDLSPKTPAGLRCVASLKSSLC